MQRHPIKMKSEQISLNTEKEFRVLIENMEDMVIQFDKEARHLFCNKAALGAFNMSNDQIIGKTHLEAGFDKEMSHYWDEIIQRVAREGKPEFVEFDWEHDGVVSAIDWRLYPEIKNDGTINSVISVARDVTEQKNKEIALIEALGKQQESETKYRTLIESAEDRIALFDNNGKIVLANKAYYSILGYTQDEYEANKDLHWFNADIIPHLVESESQDRKAFKYEFRSQHKNGNWLYMVAKLVLVRNVNNTPIGFLSIIRDETEKKEYEKQLIRARNKAEQAQKLKTAFLANMSHEIRTPLNIINGFASIIVEKMQDDDELKGYTALMNESSNALIGLVSNIIDMAKISAGELEVIPEVVNVKVVLEELFSLYQLKVKIHETKNIELKLHFDTDNPIELYVDEKRLYQIFDCLLGNALKFTQKGEIVFGVESLGASVRLFVRDTGVGIEEDVQKLIFESFVQGSSSLKKEHGGAGVSLSLAQKLVELMGGKLLLNSTLGEGSDFHFDLPVWKEKDELSVKTNRIPEKWDDKTILVVDDMEASFELLSAIFRKTGIELKYAESGEEAIAILKQSQRIDLLLLDFVLPQRDGLELAKDIRELYPDIPIVLHTAYETEKLKKFKKTALIDDIIPKPFDSKKLRSRIGELLFP